jgi:chromosome partitioning protein
MRTIAVCTQKGGVGKTTTVANLAAAWGSRCRRVLAVDFDPQFALTRRFGIDPSDRLTIADVLESRLIRDRTAIPIRKAMVCDVAPGVDVIPAHRRLSDIEITLVRAVRRETFLRRALRSETGDHDFVLIDCPPNLGLLTVNALAAADEALIPIDMKSVDALAGAEELIATVEELEEDGPKVTALLRNRVEGTIRRRREVYRAIDDELGALQLATTSRSQRSSTSRSSSGGPTTSVPKPSAHSPTSSIGSRHDRTQGQATRLAAPPTGCAS